MKSGNWENQNLVYTSEVTECQSRDEFTIEFFTSSNGMKCSGIPMKVVRNFDELILFMEQMEETPV
ncbi:hypothetical protein RCG23_23520 [Neobacillus sp. PS3-34]|uniref:hypothetical protein n=1 Tax=Neobacillus sp. PS3-34 TaxID=3070678 RepID=UPI0027E152A6|nr:hypothetical protein [Neobacillus sp. PS3-34]WML48196.1 hypothetical protein RCG23_23520 [Neobacillus sp. PS3-34]